MKSQIIEELGQTDILLPSLIAEGLRANDRVKARLSVLQSAARHACEGARFDLGEECRTAGVDPSAMETLVNGASLAGERIVAAGLDLLIAAIWDDVETMIRAVKAGDPAAGDAAQGRLLQLKASAAPSQPADTLELPRIAELTSVAGNATLHRLVMDLHKALNRLSAAHAEQVLAGAHVYGLTPADKPLVQAFMHGVESTRKLKFDHPGLATTATRAGHRLSIQNDIGETDAHVVVITVDTEAVTVTYTDVHFARTKFFTGLFRDFAVQWSGLERKSAQGLGDGGAFCLVTGRLPAIDDKARKDFLEALGASLVFLIDWNKARKVLREWVPKSDAIQILDWGARHRFGHRGFLVLGGAELVASAIHNATPGRIGFGDRLDRALGREAAIDFLKSVLRICAEALLEGGSVRLARDRIEAELVRHLRRVDGVLLTIVVRQAGLARDIAIGLAEFIAERQAGRPFDGAALAAKARHIEEKADRIAIEARNEIERFDADASIGLLVTQAEQTIDELEDAAFVASLFPASISDSVFPPLTQLAAAAVMGAEAAAKGAAAAADVPDGQRADSEDAIAAVGRLAEAEHQADAAERAVTTLVLRGEFDAKGMVAALELARAIERSTDRMAGFGHLLRARVLAELSS